MEPQTVSFIYGYDYTTDESSLYGAACSAEADIQLGWTAEVFDLTQFDITYLAYNPMVFAQGISSAWVQFWTPQLGAKLEFQAVPYRFNFLDFQATLDKDLNFCYSLGNAQQVLEFEVNLDLSFKECSIGLFGMINYYTNGGLLDEGFECKLHEYSNDTPMWTKKYQAALDFTHDYIPWSCSFQSPEDEITVDEGFPDQGLPDVGTPQ